MSGLTGAQKKAAFADGSVAVLAGAGTGKTFLLTHRYLHHLSSGLSPLQIVATTFTDAAATELRSRIRRAVRQALPGETSLLAQVEVAPIGTMHALYQQICREYPQQSQLPAGFQIVDELQALIWFESNYPELLANLPAELFEHLEYRQLDSVLRNLLADPHQAALSLSVTRAQRETGIAAARESAFSGWQEFCRPRIHRLRQLRANGTGSTADAIETVLSAINEHGDDIDPTRLLDAIGAIRMPRKSAAWSQTDFDEVRTALEELRTRARAEQDGILLRHWSQADELHELQLTALSQAFTAIESELRRRRRDARIATFDDLENGTLRALGNDEVLSELRQRWRAFMIDEFQDTNPVQLEIIRLLSNSGSEDGARLTTVGDVKQSIYGFRRAAPGLSTELAGQIGNTVVLEDSFRSHDGLLRELDPIFAPLLADLHQPLHGNRAAPAGQQPFVSLLRVAGRGSSALRAEARLIVQKIEGLIDSAAEVWDKQAGTYRPIEYRDVAILFRTAGSVPNLQAALSEAGVPHLQTGGEDLLSTREGLDVSALLEFLHNPADDIACLTVLRSPFFAVSDTALALLAAGKSRETSWWTKVQLAPIPETERAAAILQELLDASESEKPLRLLQLADRATGYSAVLAGLPGANRRLADWDGLMAFVQQLQSGGAGLSRTVRTLAELKRFGGKVERPPLEPGNAVSLTNIHRSKGLEWPVVIVADLQRRGSSEKPPAYLHSGLGCALKPLLSDDPVPLTYLLSDQESMDAQEAEDRRLLYVAATRAADRLLFSTTSFNTGLHKTLSPAAAESGMHEEEVDPEPQLTVGFTRVSRQVTECEPKPVLLDVIPPQLRRLPVTSLALHASCPRRFEYRFVRLHPGSEPDLTGESGGPGIAGSAWRIGDLTHIALEHDITSSAELAVHDPELPAELVAEALELADNFRREAVFEPARSAMLGGRLEAETQVELSGIEFSGRVDVKGSDLILDFKTDRHPDPQRHVMQLALYAHAYGVHSAMLAYLRTGELVTFDQAALNSGLEQARQVTSGIIAGDFTATPGPGVCRICEYSQVCEFAYRQTE